MAVKQISSLQELIQIDPPLAFSERKVTSPIVEDGFRDGLGRLLFSGEDADGILNITDEGRLIDLASFRSLLDTSFNELDSLPAPNYESLYQDALDAIQDLQSQIADLLAQLDRSEQDSESLASDLARLQLNIIDEFERQVILEELSKFSRTFYDNVINSIQNDLATGFFDGTRSRIRSLTDFNGDARGNLSRGFEHVDREVQRIVSNFTLDEFILTSRHARSIFYPWIEITGKRNQINESELFSDFNLRYTVADGAAKSNLDTGDLCPIKPYIILNDKVDEQTGLTYKEPTLDPNFNRNVIQYHFKKVAFTLLAGSVSREILTSIRFGNGGRRIVAVQYGNLFLEQYSTLLDDVFDFGSSFRIRTGRLLEPRHSFDESRYRVAEVKPSDCAVLSTTGFSDVGTSDSEFLDNLEDLGIVVEGGGPLFGGGGIGSQLDGLGLVVGGSLGSQIDSLNSGLLAGTGIQFNQSNLLNLLGTTPLRSSVGRSSFVTGSNLTLRVPGGNTVKSFTNNLSRLPRKNPL